jgi:hypothetical protein
MFIDRTWGVSGGTGAAVEEMSIYEVSLGPDERILLGYVETLSQS